MNRGFATASCLALATLAFAAAAVMPAAQAQQMGEPPQCMQFPALSHATQLKASAVQAAMKAKADRKDICRLLTDFVASESKVVKFLIDNRTWCGVPDQTVAGAKANHEKSVKFRDAACAEQPAPKAPSLSDAIKTPDVDSATNTKAGKGGTFDTLTGNPLAR
ncbi:MAG: hypothetical protein WCA56_03490 [Xanthobacteraceae bacterium]